MKDDSDNILRTQVQLRASQHRRLRRLAAHRGVSMAHLVREGVDSVLAAGASATRDRWQELFSVVGKYAAGRPGEKIGRDHDLHLNEIYGTWRRSS